MCGRYTLRHPERLPTPAEILRRVDERREQETLLVPRYNIAPSQRVLIADRDAHGERVIRPATWGFRPRWYAAERRAPINARAETAADRPLFRGAFRNWRCLVPADGWYEWQARAKGPKVPHFFRRCDDAVFWFAGLAARDVDGEPTMAILTTDANAVSRPVHARMPVVLADEAAAGAWLEPDAAASTLQDLLQPAPEDLVDMYSIGRDVNNPANDGPGLIEPRAGTRSATNPDRARPLDDPSGEQDG